MDERELLVYLTRYTAARWERDPFERSTLLDPMLGIIRRHGISISTAWTFCSEVIARDALALLSAQHLNETGGPP